MTVTRHFVFVQQTIGGKTYQQKSIVYSVDNNFSLMNQFMRMDNSLYRESGAILPGRIWWTEKLEL